MNNVYVCVLFTRMYALTHSVTYSHSHTNTQHIQTHTHIPKCKEESRRLLGGAYAGPSFLCCFPSPRELIPNNPGSMEQSG